MSPELNYQRFADEKSQYIFSNIHEMYLSNDMYGVGILIMKIFRIKTVQYTIEEILNNNPMTAKISP